MEHPEHYSASEGARRTVLLVRTSVRYLRGKDTSKVDRRLEELAEEAIARETAAKAAKKK